MPDGSKEEEGRKETQTLLERMGMKPASNALKGKPKLKLFGIMFNKYVFHINSLLKSGESKEGTNEGIRQRKGSSLYT